MNEFFGLEAAGTTVRREVVGGVTTFLAMAYILFVQPAFLGAAGMDPGAVLTATCLASALATLVMGSGRATPSRWRRAWASTPSSPTHW